MWISTQVFLNLGKNQPLFEIALIVNVNYRLYIPWRKWFVCVLFTEIPPRSMVLAHGGHSVTFCWMNECPKDLRNSRIFKMTFHHSFITSYSSDQFRLNFNWDIFQQLFGILKLKHLSCVRYFSLFKCNLHTDLWDKNVLYFHITWNGLKILSKITQIGGVGP